MPKCILLEQGGKGGGGGSSNVVLRSIRIATPPTKTTYNYGESFNSAGMVVMGDYWLDGKVSIGESEVQFTYEPTGNLTHADTEITVKVIEDGQTFTATQAITVNPVITSISATQPTKNTYKYKETLDTTGIVVTANKSDGTTEPINSGITITPADGTQLTTLGITTLTIAFESFTTTTTVSVAKAEGIMTLSPTSVVIDGKNLTKTITVTTDSDGVISYTPTSKTGITSMTWDAATKTLSITGDGSTKVDEFDVSFSIGEGTYYTASTTPTVAKVKAAYWEWGSETAVGDATWWAGLKTWAAGATAAERLAVVGKKKKVTLSTAVRGWNSGANVSMICIGADIDGTGTLTFQTEGCSPSTGAFSSSNAKYSASTAKTEAEKFANNCSATVSMKSVTKLTCESEPNSTQTWAATTKSTAKGFITSDCEMGFIAGLDASNGKGYAMSYQEWTENGANKAYQYYTNNTRRVKYYCSANGDLTTSTGWYWERSRYCYDAGLVCYVNGGGTPTYTYYYSTDGRLAPAFVIG